MDSYLEQLRQELEDATARVADHWCKFHWVHGRHHARQIRERLGRV